MTGNPNLEPERSTLWEISFKYTPGKPRRVRYVLPEGDQQPRRHQDVRPRRQQAGGDLRLRRVRQHSLRGIAGGGACPVARTRRVADRGDFLYVHDGRRYERQRVGRILYRAVRPPPRGIDGKMANTSRSTPRAYAAGRDGHPKPARPAFGLYTRVVADPGGRRQVPGSFRRGSASIPTRRGCLPRCSSSGD